MEKETKLSYSLHCFCSFLVQAKRRKGKEEEKSKLEEKKSRYETLPFVNRKNPNSSHVWDVFVGLNWDLMFVLILFWL